MEFKNKGLTFEELEEMVNSADSVDDIEEGIFYLSNVESNDGDGEHVNVYIPYGENGLVVFTYIEMGESPGISEIIRFEEADEEDVKALKKLEENYRNMIAQVETLKKMSGGATA
jgi:hypothetical protein